jgi:4,5-DOPA dioxygenase extradiol
MRGATPSIFIGHGSPMNAVQDNAFTRHLKQWGHELGLPKAILVVSAHWLTEREVRVSICDQPPTIHDFGGFPADLSTMRYSAAGAPALARDAAARLAPRAVGQSERGLDHGAWTVLAHLYPAADVPVFQLSIDITRPAAYHRALGRALAGLREHGVFVVGSGNVVHNLDATMQGQPDTAQGLTPWARNFDARAKQALDAKDVPALLAYEQLSVVAMTAVPFPDHHFPLLRARRCAVQRTAAPCVRGVPGRHPQHALRAVGVSPRTRALPRARLRLANDFALASANVGCG